MTNIRKSTITAALDIVADSWTVLLLRELFLGSSTWGEFSKHLNISPATLNKRLKQLVDAGCLIKDSKPGSRTTSYLLTESGVDLFPFMITAREWQITWDKRLNAYTSPWVHNCGKPLRCRSICASCGQDVLWEDLVFEDKEEYEQEGMFNLAQRHFRASSNEILDLRSGEKLPKVIQVLGDRRACQILAVMYRGSNRFEALERLTGLHPAIISERLRKLQVLGLCHTRLYQTNPDRHEYILSPSANQLFEVINQLRQWGEKWLDPLNLHRIPLKHVCCDQLLHATVICLHCASPVHFSETHTVAAAPSK